MRYFNPILAVIASISIIPTLHCDKTTVEPNPIITGSTLWVIDQPSNDVKIFDSEGDLITTVGGFTKPIDLDIDEDNGDTYVIDFYGDQLKKFDRYGNFQFETPPPIDSDNNGVYDTFYLRQPTSVRIEQETSDVWVADYHQNKVLRLDSAGNETGKITGFLFPRTVSIYDNSGYLWVSDEGAHAVYRFSTGFSGEIAVDDAELTIEGFNRPRSVLAEAEGGCWVLDIGSGRLYKVSSSGEIVSTVYGFDEPSNIALGTAGESVLVSDSESGDVIEIDRRVLGEVTVENAGNVFLTGLNNPRGIVSDDLASVIYVCVMDEDRVGKYDLETGDELLNFRSIEGPLTADFYRAQE